MNRLLLPWQRRLWLALAIIPWALTLNAQCECGTATNNGIEQVCSGTMFTLTYTGEDTIFVGTDCMENLLIPTGSVDIDPPPFSFTFDADLTGYGLGDMVPGGTVVNVHYIISSAMMGGTMDTLCFNLTFIDNIPPQINTTLFNDTVACDLVDYPGWVAAKLNQVDMNSTDNCSVFTYHNGPASFTDPCSTLEVTFYAEDDAGNLDSVMASYTTIDTVPPAFVGVPAGVIINCEDPIPAPPNVTAMDDCTGVSNITFSENSTQTNDGSDTDNDYTIQRTWMVADDCGNLATATQIINVQDVNPPLFDVPADTTIACDAPSDTTSTGNISNISDCADLDELTISMSEVIISGSCPNNFTIQRTWTLEDLNLNVASKTQVITVVDTVQPTVTFPADITVDCTDAADIGVTGEPTDVTDNCNATPGESLTDVFIAGSCEYSYTIERTWKVWDECTDTVEHLQIITVIDTMPPVIGNEAVNQTTTCAMDIDALFSNWINDHGAATATDNCTPADSLEWTAYVAGTTDPAILPGPDCLNPEAGIFRRVTVDFIVSDDCGNQDTTTATFTVADDNPPLIMNCPSDLTVDTDPGVCEAQLLLALPVVMEDCGNISSPVSVSETLTPTIPSGSNPVETPIDDLVFNLSVPMPPVSADGAAALTIYLNDIDAESPTEFVNVFGEDGALLGAVPNTPAQCGDTLRAFTLSESQVNEWAFDGVVTITVRSNIPSGQSGIFAVNPICPGGTVTAELTYSSNDPSGLQFEYDINGGTRNAVSPLAAFSETFAQGTSTVNYYVIDCAGNESTCDFTVTVEDNEGPGIVCPSDLSVTLASGNCEEEVEVPLFLSVTDNCGVTTPTTQTQPADSLGSLITFAFNPNLGDFVAEDKTFTFSGLEGNATPGGVQLIVTVLGDVDSVGAYFEIYDNDGNLLGNTSNGQANVTAGDCNTPSVATFTIPATTFNDWASAGDITITAKSFTNYPIPPAGPGWGINPCDAGQVSSDGDTDGSFITAMFSYESVSPTFSASGANTIDPLELTPPLEAQTYTLSQGTTTFTYSVEDLAGNYGECSFDIEVVDAEAPNALCGPAFVDINPSGFDVDTVFAHEIDLGSMDNCTIDSMSVTPNIFDCDDQGIQNIVLTVFDEAGNMSTCSTFVNVTTQAPAPSISSDCGTPDLQLFANPPASSGGSNAIYEYTWRDPNGIVFSFDENPIIQDADLDNIGFYSVEIEGVSGCISESTVQVTCNLLPLAEPMATVNSNSICASETVELTTASVCGSSVAYKWYSGNFPGSLIATTTTPSYTTLPPATGVFNFYVVVERNGCESEPSDPVQVTVNDAPTALVAQESIVRCEGEQVLLESLNNPVGATCQWIGPAGFVSNSCNPAPINNSQLTDGGFYQLIVTNNGCESIPDTAVVNIIERPDKPTASSSTSASNPACDGESIVLTATAVAGAVSYKWTSPSSQEFTSATNSLTLPACDITKDAGFWTVLVVGNPCESEPSDAFEVFIEPLPEAVEATADPVNVCEGQTLSLFGSSATLGVNYLWTTPSGQTFAQAEPTIENVDDAEDGTYNLLVTSQFGCTNSATVEVNILDRVEITGIASDVPNCPQGPVDVNLVATLFPPDNGSYQYSWTGPNFASTDAMAVIPEATDLDAGPYILMVTNGDGCESLPVTLTVDIPEVLAAPTPPTTTSGDFLYCEGETLTLNTEGYNGTATYIWTTPTGTFSTASESLTLNDLTVSEEGAYTVQYQVGDCISPVSGILDLEVNPIPAINPTSNSPVCESSIIEMNVACDNGAEYEWTGPTGFNPTVCNPSILNANPDLHTGIYTVRKKVDGCWSNVAAFTVEVKDQPAVPTAVNNGPYCADTEDVVLSVTQVSSTPDAIYTWFDADSIPLGSATPSLNFAVPNGTIFEDGTYEFFAIANLDGCPSTPSVPTVVTINTIPQNLAEAGDDLSACEGRYSLTRRYRANGRHWPLDISRWQSQRHHHR